MIARRVPGLALALALLAGCGTAGPTPTIGTPLASPTTGSPSPDGSPDATPGSSTPAIDGPTFGAWHALVATADGILLVNGAPESGQPADAPLELWTWDGAAWTQVPVTGEWPVWRNFGTVAWDETRQALVLHGGLQGPGADFAETWEWRGRSWTLAVAGDVAPGPGFREGAAMAWDPNSASTILVGGAGADGNPSDTWAWDGSAWEQLAPDGAGPSPRFPALFEAEPAGHGLILYGGHVLDGPEISVADTWRWDGASWAELSGESPPGPRVNVAGVEDGAGDRILLIGGGRGDETLGDVWAWDGVAWTEVAPDAFPRRQAAGAAFDAATGQVLLSGGLDRPGTAERYSDLWGWSGDGPAVRLWPAGG